MKTESQAWKELQEHAAAQLRPDFADRVLRVAEGPTPAAWQQLQARAAAQIRPGFADRVLRAARQLAKGPSLFDQLLFGAGTAAICLVGVLFMHERTLQVQEERNLARWERLVVEAQEMEIGR